MQLDHLVFQWPCRSDELSNSMEMNHLIRMMRQIGKWLRLHKMQCPYSRTISQGIMIRQYNHSESRQTLKYKLLNEMILRTQGHCNCDIFCLHIFSKTNKSSLEKNFRIFNFTEVFDIIINTENTLRLWQSWWKKANGVNFHPLRWIHLFSIIHNSLPIILFSILCAKVLF